MLGGYFVTKYRYLGTALDPNPFYFWKGVVPFSNRFHWKQSRVLWLPFLSRGQVQRWHPPAAFLLLNLDPSIPSV
jgi:hypothetical protein